MSKYFSPAEFKRCTPSCSIEQMDPAFLERLDRFREFVGIPLVLSCAYRSLRWELSRGRTGSWRNSPPTSRARPWTGPCRCGRCT